MTRDELIREMSKAGNKACGLPATTPSGDHYDENITFCTGALDVVLDEVLGDGDADEKNRFPVSDAYLNRFLASRRAHYSKVKTAEERVTVEPRGVVFQIMIDGKYDFSFGSKDRAEIYRLGLIQHLKNGGLR